MTTRFREQIIPWTFKWEGTKFENDPDDPGGATKFGIDQRSHPGVDIRSLTADQATVIYWDEYYTKYRCDEKAPPMDWILFNACVNCGWGRASKLLAESGGDPKRFLEAQAAFYRRLAIQRPRSKKYLKGWLARLSDLARVTNVKVNL